jgi:hypothetical protein
MGLRDGEKGVIGGFKREKDDGLLVFSRKQETSLRKELGR